MNSESRSSAAATELSRPTMFASLRQPGYPPLYVAGFLFSASRWSLGFLAAFMATELTGSPRAVQLTGVAQWAPLFLAGVAAGLLADRFDRRTVLLSAVALLTPGVLIIGLLAMTDQLVVAMLYPLMVAVGLSQVVDMTSRRTLVLDIVGSEHIDNAMALESLATAIALALGVLAGGAAIEVLGVGQAFFVVAGLLVVAGSLFVRLAPDRKSRTRGGGPETPNAEGSAEGLRSALRLVTVNRRLRLGLGVTVIGNVFYFSHTPLVPLLADDLGVGPSAAGLLAAAGGLGMMVSSLGVARLRPPRGLSYVLGTGVALTALISVGFSTGYATLLASLFVSALGFGVFGATQSVVIMTSVGPAHRGRAMGLLSMAIGALPVGMYTLGEVAERVGAPTAIVLYASTGLALLVVGVGRRISVLAEN